MTICHMVMKDKMIFTNGWKILDGKISLLIQSVVLLGWIIYFCVKMYCSSWSVWAGHTCSAGTIVLIIWEPNDYLHLPRIRDKRQEEGEAGCNRGFSQRGHFAKLTCRFYMGINSCSTTYNFPCSTTYNFHYFHYFHSVLLSIHFLLCMGYTSIARLLLSCMLKNLRGSCLSITIDRTTGFICNYFTTPYLTYCSDALALSSFKQCVTTHYFLLAFSQYLDI